MKTTINMYSRPTYSLLSIIFLILLSGCAQTYYSWNGYDEALYENYKNPGEREDFIESLSLIIQKAEEKGKIPPGLYAEYGYTFYETGNYQQAVLYFQKEAQLWPDSKFFMDKMIKNANTQKKQSTNNESSKQN